MNKMKFKIFVITLVAYFALFIPAKAEVRMRIAGFQAFLFNSKTGVLSENILAKGAPEMGNVMSGQFASVSTFVIVKVELGNHTPVPQNARIRLLAIESGTTPFSSKKTKKNNRIILDSVSSLGPVNTDGNTYVGFWLQRTGCQTVTLTASPLGVEGVPSLTEMLPFTCYE